MLQFLQGNVAVPVVCCFTNTCFALISRIALSCGLRNSFVTLAWCTMHHFTPNVLPYLSTVILAHLRCTIDVLGVKGGLGFLEFHVISVAPLMHCVHFKRTHLCNSIHFHGDTAARIR